MCIFLQGQQNCHLFSHVFFGNIRVFQGEKERGRGRKEEGKKEERKKVGKEGGRKSLV